VDVQAGQTAPLFRARQVNALYDAYMSAVTDIMTIDADGTVNAPYYKVSGVSGVSGTFTTTD